MILKKIIQSIGRRGHSLLFFAFLYMVMGQSYLTTPPLSAAARDNLYIHLSVMPLKWWAAVWLASGALNFLGALMCRLQPLAFGIASAVMSVWATAFGINQLLGHGYRGYVAFFLYNALAAFILLISGWPEEGEMNGTRQ